jgi:hypothetical protein
VDGPIRCEKNGSSVFVVSCGGLWFFGGPVRFLSGLLPHFERSKSDFLSAKTWLKRGGLMVFAGHLMVVEDGLCLTLCRCREGRGIRSFGSE